MMNGMKKQRSGPLSKAWPQSVLAFPAGSSRGFSLVELMVAVVIIGLLAALAVPTVSQSMERSRYNDFNRAIASGFQEARMFAVNNGQAVFVDIGGQTVTFYRPANFEVGTGGAMSCTVAEDVGPTDENRLLEVNAQAYGLGPMTLETMPAATNRVCISPRGRVVNDGGQFISSGCDTFNFVLWTYPTAATLRDLGDCPTFDQASKDNRQIDKIYAIHVGYNGQVRVIR